MQCSVACGAAAHARRALRDADRRVRGRLAQRCVEQRALDQHTQAEHAVSLQPSRVRRHRAAAPRASDRGERDDRGGEERGVSEERRGGDDRGERREERGERGGGKMTEERRRGNYRGEERGDDKGEERGVTEERREG